MQQLPLRDRVIAGAGTLVMLALIGAVMLGLGAGTRYVREAATALISIANPPPPPPKIHVSLHAPGKEGRSSSPKPAPLPKAPTPAPVPAVTPRPVVPVIAAPAPVAAPTAGGGAGIGNGEGLGGRGNGRGLGDAGDGEGGGGTPPEQIRGELKSSDVPEELRHSFTQTSVSVRYRVGVDGRASACRITRSSGMPALDQIACQLIEQRFRFRPALDEQGRPVSSSIVENHSWTIERDPRDR